MQQNKSKIKYIILITAFVMGVISVDSSTAFSTNASTAFGKKSVDKVDLKNTGFKKPSNIEHANDNASSFVKNLVDQAITSLSNQNVSLSSRHRRFTKMLNQSFDMRFISQFTMGRYWRIMNKKQRKTYQKLLTKLLAKNYASLFENYAGEQVNIIGSVFDKQNKQTIVKGQLIKKNGQIVSLRWRLHMKNKKLKMLDISVEGISMLTTQREEMISVVQNHGNNIDKLLSFLKSRL